MINTKGRVTIKDIALHTNVTAQTVSRVLRGVDYVAEETRQKVLQAARELNYIPSYAAKALRNGMSQSIAIVFDSLRNVYFSIMIDHLRKEIKERGYSVQLLFSDEATIHEDIYRKAVSHGAVAVISFLEEAQGLGQTVRECGIPVMIFGRTTVDEGLDYVTTDDYQGGTLAANYLISRGCTKFRYVVEGSGLTCARERFSGYSDTLKARGYTAEFVDCQLIDWDFDSMELADPDTGVFCFSDILAFQLIKRMSTIPPEKRIKIVGYDNIQSDIVLPINLTTVGLDKEKHAKLVVDSILQKLSDPEKRFAIHEKVTLFGAWGGVQPN